MRGKKVRTKTPGRPEIAMLKLYYAPNACSLAPHIALNETGAEYEAVKVDTRNGEQRGAAYLVINPKGRVPTLVTERGTLTEVPVILGFIARNFPKAELAPADGFEFFRMQSFNSYLSSTIHGTFGHLFRPERYADSDAAKAEMRAHVPQSLAQQFRLVEDQLSDGREWVQGRYSVSDPYLYVFARWLAREDSGGIENLPKLKAHRARMQTRPAVLKTLEQEGLEPL
jgi:glutathione S-transferase